MYVDKMLAGREWGTQQKQAEGDGIVVFYCEKKPSVLVKKKIKRLKEKNDKLIHSEKNWGNIEWTEKDKRISRGSKQKILQ